MMIPTMRPSTIKGIRSISHSIRSCRHTSIAFSKIIVAAQGSETEEETSSQTNGKLKQTLADLDALLGIQDEPPKTPPPPPPPPPTPNATISVAPDVLSKIAEAEAARLGKTNPEEKAKLENALTRLVEQARKIAAAREQRGGGGASSGDRPSSSGRMDPAAEKELQKAFEDMLSEMRPDEVVKREDLDRIRKEICNPLTVFNVTEVRPLENLSGGYLLRGAVRGKDRGQVASFVVEAVEKEFGDRYACFALEDPVAMMEEETDVKTGKSKIAFEILPRARAAPPPTRNWEYVAAALLFFLTMGSAFSLGITVNIPTIPPETLAALQDPRVASGEVPLPGMTDIDVVNYLIHSIPVSLLVFATQIAHEGGHSIAASLQQVKLGARFFVPNGALGSFGSVTPLASLVKSRSVLWNVAAAGPLVGGGVSLAMFIMGLVLSHPDVSSSGSSSMDVVEGAATVLSTASSSWMIPVPSQLFQGSLLLGTISRFSLGSAAMAHVTVPVHPLLIAGWCGLVTNALNVTPVGCLDGGRMMQAAFGRAALNLTSLVSYMGFALGFLGSSLALPFGLYVLILQRNPERYLQDEVSDVSDGKRWVTMVAVIVALLILLPMAPEVSDSMGVGGPQLFL